MIRKKKEGADQEGLREGIIPAMYIIRIADQGGGQRSAEYNSLCKEEEVKKGPLFLTQGGKEKEGDQQERLPFTYSIVPEGMPASGVSGFQIVGKKERGE